VDGVEYSWDNNGNLIYDGVNTYAYDTANRLTAFSNQQSAVSYAYNGLGDRLRETVNGQTTTFTMDLNAGLTQALSDGTNTYLYGLDRIAQVNGASTDYFLGDALGSVRQMTDVNGALTYVRAYGFFGQQVCSAVRTSRPIGLDGAMAGRAGVQDFAAAMRAEDKVVLNCCATLRARSHRHSRFSRPSV
jgi:YD repeat-containing protein